MWFFKRRAKPGAARKAEKSQIITELRLSAMLEKIHFRE